MPEGWAGSLGMYPMSAHVDSWRLILEAILKKGGVNHEREN